MARKFHVGKGSLGMLAIIAFALSGMSEEDGALLRMPGSAGSVSKAAARERMPGPMPSGSRAEMEQWLYKLQIHVGELRTNPKYSKETLTASQKAEITHAGELVSLISGELDREEPDWRFVTSLLSPLAQLPADMPPVVELFRRLLKRPCDEQRPDAYFTVLTMAIEGFVGLGSAYHDEYMTLIRPESWEHINCGEDTEKFRVSFRLTAISRLTWVLPLEESRALLERVKVEYSGDQGLLGGLQRIEEEVSRLEHGLPRFDPKTTAIP